MCVSTAKVDVVLSGWTMLWISTLSRFWKASKSSNTNSSAPLMRQMVCHKSVRWIEKDKGNWRHASLIGFYVNWALPISSYSLTSEWSNKVLLLQPENMTAAHQVAPFAHWQICCYIGPQWSINDLDWRSCAARSFSDYMSNYWQADW